jgi:hypothetical protein
MIGALIGSLMQMGGAYGALRFKRFKARIIVKLVTLLLLAFFALLAFIFLCVLAFLALAQAYSPMAAAFILFCVSCIFCLGIWVIHLLASRESAEAPDADMVEKLKSQLPSTLALGMALGRQTKNLSRALFTPKKIALAIVLAACTAVASHPVSTYRVIKRLVHKDIEEVERKRFPGRFFHQFFK